MLKFYPLILSALHTVVAAVTLGAPPASASMDDNKGTEFIIGFSRNFSSANNLTLFITGDATTNGTVQIPGLAFSTPFAVAPGSITSVSLPQSATVSGSDAISNLGVRVSADEEIVVYGLNQEPFSTDAFLGLPTDILDTEYIVLAFNALLPSQFLVVGVEDGTTVTITPSVTVGARAAGVPYDIALNRLDTYQLEANTIGADLTGTIITSDRPITVLSGGRCVNVPPADLFCDHLVEQLPPTSTWGVSFLTVPLATRTGGDIFRVLARDDATDVQVDGISAGIVDRGEFVELDLSSGTYHEITTTGPALVAQYSKGEFADLVMSDPFEMLIPPTEQFLNAYTVTTPAASPVSFNNFINVVVPDADIPSCLIDGGAFSAPFTPIGTSGFSGAQEPVSIGTHNLSCPDDFGVYSYGFASADSYGYPGGLALKPIAIEAIDLAPDVDLNPPGSDHTVTALLTVDVSDPLAGIDVDFDVVEGPNFGDGGSDTSDANGEAQFTYTGDGGKGVDDIVGSFVDSDGDLVSSDPVRKFWDDDCQPNDIPDTCDLDCDGFDGLCLASFPLCGGSTDLDGDGQPDECNLPPDCSGAITGPDELWPPNHKFQEISVAGVADPDGDPVFITIESIFQDEPVNGRGDGNTCADGAGVGAESASVRAERSGTKKSRGDGRVYHIGFTADDGRGGSCTASVTVCVPHDRRRGHACVDQGPLFDSTLCDRPR